MIDEAGFPWPNGAFTYEEIRGRVTLASPEGTRFPRSTGSCLRRGNSFLRGHLAAFSSPDAGAEPIVEPPPGPGPAVFSHTV